jgi:hypothetical protein
MCHTSLAYSSFWLLKLGAVNCLIEVTSDRPPFTPHAQTIRRDRSTFNRQSPSIKPECFSFSRDAQNIPRHASRFAHSPANITADALHINADAQTIARHAQLFDRESLGIGGDRLKFSDEPSD